MVSGTVTATATWKVEQVGQRRNLHVFASLGTPNYIVGGPGEIVIQIDFL